MEWTGFAWRPRALRPLAAAAAETAQLDSSSKLFRQSFLSPIGGASPLPPTAPCSDGSTSLKLPDASQVAEQAGAPEGSVPEAAASDKETKAEAPEGSVPEAVASDKETK
ncbi:unnamed protein product, partial [Polarella glacialis]